MMMKGRPFLACRISVFRGQGHSMCINVVEVHTPDRVADFYQKNPAAPRQIRAAIFAQIPFKPLTPVYFKVKQSLKGR